MNFPCSSIAVVQERGDIKLGHSYCWPETMLRR